MFFMKDSPEANLTAAARRAEPGELREIVLEFATDLTRGALPPAARRTT